MKYDNQLRYAVQIVNSFKGDMPLHNWLKSFFKVNKQMGSKDRKQVAELVFDFYRLGHAGKSMSPADRLLAGLFLCSTNPSELLGYFRPSWNEQAGRSVKEKLTLLQDEKLPIQWQEIFPWASALSDSISHEALCLSFLRQPDLFLRVRPGHEAAVREKMATHPHEWMTPHSLRLPNGSKVDDILEMNRDVVVQDYNSQRTGEFFPDFSGVVQNKLLAWDCCAASGGKSIMLHDRYPDIQLLVSDLRSSVLDNLRTRFATAGIDRYQSVEADLSKPGFILPFPTATFDLLLIDAPCTGSGTWSRNPDALYYFDASRIDRLAQLQQRIIAQALPYLRAGQSLLYITCSVFKKENEWAVEQIVQRHGLRLERSELLSGIEMGADSLYAALLTA